MNYSKHANTKVTPQSQPIFGKSMVANSAGGFSFQIRDWDRLDRFLILGSEGGSYYATEKKLTIDNANTIVGLIDSDGIRVVNKVVEISEAGRAPKNDPAIFVLALAACAKDVKIRQAALNALPRVCRIGTHLFHFAQFVDANRGWGRSLRNAVASWYNGKDINSLINQVIKYKQRDGWSNRDLLRLSHPHTLDATRNEIYKWVVKPDSAKISLPGLERISAAVKASTETDEKKLATLIHEHNLPREVVNTDLLNSVSVWEALLQKMPVEAMVRNLGKMTSIGLLSPLSDAANKVVSVLGDAEKLAAARIHPLSLLVALNTYASGSGVKGGLTWTPNTAIVDALDRAFYTSFGNVKPTGKRLLLALDVSGSMSWNDIAGMTGVTPRVGSAAMSLITASVEKNYIINGFCKTFVNLKISPRQRLDDAVRSISNLGFGGTDCSLPMRWALENKIPVDAFVVYTDSETWAGDIHPVQALRQYRDKMGIAAKLIVVGMTANEFSIADKEDRGMLDVVGFDTAAPNIMSDFIVG